MGMITMYRRTIPYDYYRYICQDCGNIKSKFDRKPFGYSCTLFMSCTDYDKCKLRKL